MKVQFVTKKVDGTFEAATVINGKFDRAATGTSIAAVFSKLVGPFLTGQQEDGTEVLMDISITTALEAAEAAAGAQPAVVQ